MKTKHSHSLSVSSSLLTSGMLSLTLVSLTSNAQHEDVQFKPAKISEISTSVQQQKLNSLTLRNKKTTTTTQQYIVQLSQPSASRFAIEQQKLSPNKAAKAKLNSRASKQYKSALKSEQQQIFQKIKAVAPQSQIIKHYDTLVNAIAIKTTASSIHAIRHIPGVKKVLPVNNHYIKTDANHEVINSPTAWQLTNGQQNAGKNIKIAIIDTGIRNDNPLFFGDGHTPPDLSQNSHLQDNPDYCRADDGDANFCNNKLIIARWIDPTGHEVDVYANEHLSPLDFNGHGSHVAGIAAGNAVDITFKDVPMSISGVAPASYLMVYKALYTDGQGYGFGSDTMLLEALELAVKDGADVINNSWGSGVGFAADSIFQTAITNAEDSGIVVVNAAGNDLHSGQGTKINCPACIESGIAVANTTHGRFFSNKLNIGEQVFYGYQGETNHIENDLSLPLKQLSILAPNLTNNCGDYTDLNFDGGVILIDYKNECTFTDISNKIKQAGGDIIIAYQSGSADELNFEPLYTSEPDLAIPVLGVTRQTGLKLVELATNNSTIAVNKSLTASVDPLFADKLHPFSSTGPSTDNNVLKPDIAAPGTYILSALSPDVFEPLGFPNFGKPAKQTNNITFGLLTGTSMASPHVAGSAALLKQHYPSWNAKQIKSALTSTANNTIYNGADLATPFGIGAGRLDLANIDTVGLSFSQVSKSDGACIGQCDFSVTVENLTDSEQTWSVHATMRDNSSYAILDSDTITLTANGTDNSKADFHFTINTDRSELGKWLFGQLTFSNSTQTEQHMPIAVFNSDTDDSGIISVSTETGDVTTNSPIEFTTFVRNKNLSEDVVVTVAIPNNAQLVDNSETVEVHHGQSTSLTIDETTGNVIWQGKLTQGNLSLTPVDAWGNTTLASENIAPVACTQGCIAFNAVIDFNFNYIGRSYSQITLSDNGFAIPGTQSISQWDALFNQKLPNERPLNNVIAPLWTEFDLDDLNDNEDYGHGSLRTAIKTIDGKNYLIAEWYAVELYDVDNYLDSFERKARSINTPQYTFQLIIEENTDNIWFNYLQVPEIPTEATIGAENIDGSTGVSLYFDGEDSPLPSTIPSQGYTLKLTTVPEGIATIQYKLELTDDNQTFAHNDAASLDEDSNINIAVIDNDDNFTYLVVDSTADIGNSYQATRTKKVNLSSAIDTATLALVTQPEHGTATVVDGKINYAPNANYAGNDSLKYKVADGAGKYSTATVSLTVNALNDAPVLAEIDPQTVAEKAMVNINVTANDVDNNQVSFSWQQTEGPTVVLTETDSGVRFTAPEVKETTELKFKVTASDGELTGSKTATVMVKNKKSGGSMGSLFLWLTGLLIISRATKKLTYWLPK